MAIKRVKDLATVTSATAGDKLVIDGATARSITFENLLLTGTKPIVILADGQSNINLTKTFAWTPNPNAFIWNNPSGAVGTGTAFTALDPTTIGIAEQAASVLADKLVRRKVYLIKNAVPAGQPISHWLTGTGAPDMYANAVANVAAALAVLGLTKIDYYLRWQGEADAPAGGPLNTGYVADFATMMTRYFGNSWFPQETGVLICGVGPTDGGFTLFPQMNDLLIGCVNARPDTRRFLETTSFVGATYWDAGNTPHMTAQGYFSTGALAASLLLEGPGRGTVPSVIVDPATGKVNVGVPAVPSARLTVNENSYPVVDGSLGFGSTALHLIGANAAITGAVIESFGAFPFLGFRTANGTPAAKTQSLANNTLCAIFASGYDSNNAYAVGPQISMRAAANWTIADHASSFHFFGVKTGATAQSEWFRNHISGGATIGSGSIATDPGDNNLLVSGIASAVSGMVPGSFTVATLPAGATGKMVFVTNARVFNGAGVQEGAGAGTGGLGTYNGTAWKLAGTNTTVIA